MPKATKRKVRRLRHRPKPSRLFSDGVWAPIVGEFSGKLYHFQLVDAGDSLPFHATDRAVYQRVSVAR
jgi:hypothetical protein